MKNDFQIPKRNSYNFFKQKKAEVGANPANRSTRESLLERTKLSNLQSGGFNNIPFPNQTPQKPTVAVCVNCKTSMAEREFLKARLCPTCMQSYAVMSNELDRAADEKAKANRLKMFAVK